MNVQFKKYVHVLFTFGFRKTNIIFFKFYFTILIF